VRQVTVTYAYTDEDGRLMRLVYRYPGKQFRTLVLDPRPVLYRLPGVRQAIAQGATVHLCEGEKDADTLTARGLAATTMAGSRLHPCYGYQLYRADLCIVADRDAEGYRRAEACRRYLEPFCASVTVTSPLAGKDMSD
jgi:hypothetical protein